MAVGFFEKSSIDIMAGLDQLAQNYQSSLSGDMSNLFTAAASLYVLWMGYYIISGKTQTPVQDLVWRCVAMMMIMTFVDYSSGYLSLVESAVDGLKSDLSGSGNVWSNLDRVWSVTQELADTVYSLDSSTFKLEGFIAQLLVWGGSIILMGVGAIIFLSSEVSIKLLLLTAPLFIFCLMWGFLRTMFNNWLQAIFSSLLTVMFASLVIGMSVEFQSEMLSVIKTQANNDVNIVTIGAMGAMAGILSAGMVYIAAQQASRLAGVGVDGVVQGMAMVGVGAALLAANKARKAIGSGADKAKQPNPSMSGPASGMTRAEQNAERLKRKRGY